mmetsp:Transcript_17692/g.40008  ORF Transcript_17692/g.40008 Transcript_17692/m.40008 type:complete len:217 (+) Transcript_17692:393-1043(+)
MDQGFPVESHLLGCCAVLEKLLLVLDVQMHPIERHEAMSSSRQQHHLQRGLQGEPAWHVQRVQVLGQVGGAHDDCLQRIFLRLLGERADVRTLQHPHRAFNHAPYREVLPRLLGDQLLCLDHDVPALYLRDDNSVRLALGDGAHVVFAPLSIEPIAPDGNLSLSKPSAIDLLHHIQPCVDLDIGSNGVFEIHDDDVSRERSCLGDSARVRPRKKQH